MTMKATTQHATAASTPRFRRQNDSGGGGGLSFTTGNDSLDGGS
jgi:hypothetical protein